MSDTPQMHRLYRFVTEAAGGEEVDQEWEGWWSGRNWHALYDMGIWDPQFVVRWEPVDPDREQGSKALRQYADDLADNESADVWDKASFVADVRSYADDYVEWLS